MKELREWLMTMKSKLGVVRLKGGTEVEDMTFAEIAFMKELSRDIVPVTVKIGGPEARNDMRAMKKIGNVLGVTKKSR